MAESAVGPVLSVIVSLSGHEPQTTELYSEYRTSLETLGLPYELIFVLDGIHATSVPALCDLRSVETPFTVVELARNFGGGTALMAGFSQAKGRQILVLPGFRQIEARDIPMLVSELSSCDIAIGHRRPLLGGPLQRFRRWTFRALLQALTRHRYADPGCRAYCFDRRVLEEIQVYGEQHRFLPVLANRQGFTIGEVDLRPSGGQRSARRYGVFGYARGLLDVVTIAFLVRFTKKPLRFFGMLGVGTLATGGLLTAWLVVERLVFRLPLAERPALLLSSLLVVVGLQLFAIGLLGEIIIFTHATEIKDYQIRSVIRFPDGRERRID